jgi:hypothetical protein
VKYTEVQGQQTQNRSTENNPGEQSTHTLLL